MANIIFDEFVHVGRKLTAQTFTASAGSPHYILGSTFGDANLGTYPPAQIIVQESDGTPVFITPEWELDSGFYRLVFKTSLTNVTIIWL